MSAILGRKVGMTSIYNEAGTQTVVTVIEAGPCVVTQVKTADGPDGYAAVQLGYQDKKAKHTTKALAGHFEAVSTAPKRHLVEFRDYGLDVELGQTLSVADIFVDDGEATFRELERSAVADLLAEAQGVVSLGGGAVLDAGTRALLKGHRTLLLQVDLSSASSRVGMNRDRPVLALNPRAQLKQLLDARMPLYLEVATDVVDTSNRSARQVADDVTALLAAAP